MILDLYKVRRQTKIYRYISLAQFLSLVERKKTYLTKITEWDDPYEDLLKYLSVENSPYKAGDFRTFKNYYAQSWSLEADSEAMWRIYSKQNSGICIQTRVEKLKQISGIEKGLCGRVIYYKNLKEVLKKLNENRSKENLHILRLALLKRSAFIHEKEVRFISIEKYFDSHINTDTKFLEFELSPIGFIEEVQIDPRAESWYVKAIKKYCENRGLNIPVIKSKLYEFDISKLDGLKIKFNDN